jgi:hypothetical protein
MFSGKNYFRSLICWTDVWLYTFTKGLKQVCTSSKPMFERIYFTETCLGSLFTTFIFKVYRQNEYFVKQISYFITWWLKQYQLIPKFVKNNKINIFLFVRVCAQFVFHRSGEALVIQYDEAYGPVVSLKLSS